VARQQHDRAGWIGIPSVPPQRIGQAFVSFYLAIGVAVAVDVLLITHNHRPTTWQLLAEAVFDDGSQIAAWALAATWPIMEAMRIMLASILEKRTYNRGREQGREEGREEMNLLEEWNERRMEAEARGERFTEPSPNEDTSGST